MTASSNSRVIRRSACMALGCVTALTGCSSITTPGLTSYSDASDACNAYRQPLIASEVSFPTWTLVGAAGGALAGAGLGGALSHGDLTGILAGAAAGALAGGATGYLAARRQQTSNQEELVRGIEQDAASDSRLVANVTKAVEGLGECRRGEIASLRHGVETGAIDKEQARADADAIQARIASDNELIAAVLGRVDQRLGVYADARSEVLGKPGSPSGGQIVPISQPGPVIVASEVPAIQPAAGIYVAHRGANVRAQPSPKSEVVGALAADERISITGRTQDGQWLEFSRDGKPAFVAASLASEYIPGGEVEHLAVEREKMASAQQVASIRTENELKALEALI